MAEIGTAEKFEGTDVRANSVLQFLALGGFSVKVIAGPQNGDEDRGQSLRPTLGLLQGKRRPGVIDEQVLFRDMFQAQHHIQPLSPALVLFAKVTVSVLLTRLPLTPTGSLINAANPAQRCPRCESTTVSRPPGTNPNDNFHSPR